MTNTDTNARIDSERERPTPPTPITLTSKILLALGLALVLIGDVLAFNQLATQSPTDAVFQLVVFSIGGAGLVEGVRRMIFPTSRVPRRTAFVPGVLGMASLLVWRLHLPSEWFVLLSVFATAACGTAAYQTLWGSLRSEQPESEVFGLLCFAQTLAFGYLTVLAALDVWPRIFN